MGILFSSEPIPDIVAPKSAVVVNNYLLDHSSNSEGIASREIIPVSNKDNRYASPIQKLINSSDYSERITIGQGEYVVFHSSLDGGKREISRDMFDQVYKILNRYSPMAMINYGKDVEEISNRYRMIQSKISEIDPSLEAVFIPRTLYELIFIRKCIKEDLKQKEICDGLSPGIHQWNLEKFKGDHIRYTEFLESIKSDRLKRKCWHLCYFADAGNDDHPGVQDVVYRLNQYIVEKLVSSNRGLKYSELSACVDKEIEFLKKYYQNPIKEILHCVTPGPTTNFATESRRGSIRPMGIRNENDAEIIRKALVLDCSMDAINSVILYRGADFKQDLPFTIEDKERPYSLSYGTSLFAGCVFDGGATAFHHMRNKKNAYAILIPFDRLKNSPFYVPQSHSITQLFSDGEIFHARTKAWKNFNVQKIDGMNIGANSHIRDHLQSNLTKDVLITQFVEYKNSAVHLNTLN